MTDHSRINALLAETYSMPIQDDAPPARPDIAAAAIAIHQVAAELTCDSNEPYRTAAYLLGYAYLDGSEWWDSVMDRIG